MQMFETDEPIVSTAVFRYSGNMGHKKRLFEDLCRIKYYLRRDLTVQEAHVIFGGGTFDNNTPYS